MSEHNGMQTRREVLERWEFVDRKSWNNPDLTGYSLEAHALRTVLNARGVHRDELRHELALLMSAEYVGGTGMGNGVWLEQVKVDGAFLYGLGPESGKEPECVWTNITLRCRGRAPEDLMRFYGKRIRLVEDTEGAQA